MATPAPTLDHIVLSFAHRGEAEHFFREVLNCEVLDRSDDATTLQVGAQRITLHDGEPGSPPLPAGHLAFRVTDLSSWRARLEGYGIATEGPVRKGGCERLYVEGPDGLRLELMTPLGLRRKDPDDLINLF